MASLVQEIRFGLRLLARNPGFAVVAVLTLALGIGANTTIFSVVDGVLLRPAPVANLERLAMVWETDRNSGTTREPASVPDYLDFVRRPGPFDELAAMIGTEVNLEPVDGEPVRLDALAVTHRLLPMLGIEPLLGRVFTEDEDRPGGPHVALIGESLWRRSFGRRPGVIGETLRFDGVPYTIVGVAPDRAGFGVVQILSAADYSRGFADRGAGGKVEVWTPLQPDPVVLPRQTHPLLVIGRLAERVTAASAQQEMTATTADLERVHPENAGRGAFVEPLAEVVFGPVRPALLVLLGAVGIVLLVACANVASLLLARGAGRAREIAIRAALGADRARLARQFVVEGLVLVLIAAGAGILLAAFGTDALAALSPAEVPRLDEVSIDLRVLAGTTLVSLLIGLVFGLVPIVQAGRVEVAAALKGGEGPHASAGPAGARLRSALVVAELSLSVVLVVAAGLMLKSFWRLLSVDPGFSATGVVKVEYRLPASRYPAERSSWPNLVQVNAFTETLLRRVAALPGVRAAAVAANHPLDPGFTNSFSVVGREDEARTWPEIAVRRQTPDYFRTLGLGLVRGRLLRDTDGATSPPVLLVNEAAARRFFPGGDPVGERIRLWGAARAIVGVVADERFRGLGEPAPMAVYLPLLQAPSLDGAGVLLVRAEGDPDPQIAAVRRVIRDLDPALAVFGAEPLAATVSHSVAQRRFIMLILGLFAATTLVLAAVGVYGVLSHTVARRTREFGIRMALGARPAQVLKSVVVQGLLLTFVGLAGGLVAARALTRVLSGLLFGVGPGDPSTFLAVALFLAIVALAASWLPARRAMRIDPAMALRSE